jgi:hypothetical protein
MVGYVARMGDTINAYTNLVGNPELQNTWETRA